MSSCRHNPETLGLDPRADLPNYIHYFAGSQTLQNVGASSCLERPLNFDLTGKGRQYDDPRFRKFAANRDHSIHTIHLGHLQVHQRNVRAVSTELHDSFVPIACLRN